MMEFLTQPVPMWLFLLPFALLIAAGIAVVLAIKAPKYEDPPHP
jgi:hypothetical protein